jgi:hypothetical protein
MEGVPNRQYAQNLDFVWFSKIPIEDREFRLKPVNVVLDFVSIVCYERNQPLCLNQLVLQI